jgi:glutaredoxin
MRFSPVRLPALIAIVGLGACHRSAPEVAPSLTALPASIEVLKGGRWLFTYAEPAGTFATTDKPETVPAEARALVRVLDPAEPMSMSTKSAGDRVYVTNLNELTAKGKSSARAMSREAFETAALAGLPGGQSSPFAAERGPAPSMAPPGAGAPGPGGAAAGAPASGTSASGASASGATPAVTIYGTSWCGACRAAREFLTERKIPFADKDVERDPDAARELAAKASKMGIPTDRVPIIDVRGRLLLGFDRARIEALLGQPT